MRVLDKPVSAGRAIIAANGDRSQDKKVGSGNVSEKRGNRGSGLALKPLRPCGFSAYQQYGLISAMRSFL
jgi:hypothetical protein